MWTRSTLSVHKLYSFSMDTCSMSSSPLVSSLVKNRLFKTAPDIDEPPFQFIHTMDLSLVDTTLHDSPLLLQSFTGNSFITFLAPYPRYLFIFTITVVQYNRQDIHLIILSVNELLKADSICKSYAQMKKGPVFFWLTVYIQSPQGGNATAVAEFALS